jgi:hypothetical protein
VAVIRERAILIYHGASRIKINKTLTDTTEHGVKIEHVFVKKGISGKESRIQCRRES